MKVGHGCQQQRDQRESDLVGVHRFLLFDCRGALDHPFTLSYLRSVELSKYRRSLLFCSSVSPVLSKAESGGGLLVLKSRARAWGACLYGGFPPSTWDGSLRCV